MSTRIGLLKFDICSNVISVPYQQNSLNLDELQGSHHDRNLKVHAIDREEFHDTKREGRILESKKEKM